MSSDDLPVKVRRYQEQRRSGGRPTELNEEVARIICEMVRIGATHERAAVAAGVSIATFYNWKQRGKEEKTGIYAEFLESLEEAEAQGEVIHLSTIHKSGSEGSKWILAARHPERYGQQTRVNVLVKQELNGVLDALEAELTTEEYEKVLAILHRRLGSATG